MLMSFYSDMEKAYAKDSVKQQSPLTEVFSESIASISVAEECIPANLLCTTKDFLPYVTSSFCTPCGPQLFITMRGHKIYIQVNW